jgi:subtilisin-like proprotein convertase family protein
MELMFAFPDAGVQVFRRRQTGRRDTNDIKRSLRTAPDTRFAGGVFVDENSREPIIYTENLFVKFDDDQQPERCAEILNSFGLQIKRPLAYSRNAYFAQAPEGIGSAIFEIAETVLDHPDVELCNPELVRRWRSRAIAATQWHLQETRVNGSLIKAHANVSAAHLVTRGQGVTIAVIDDGVDIDHEEFRTAGKIVAPRDVSRDRDDPRPRSGNHHGTACAGVACGSGRFQASGVAPDAALLPIRLASALGSQDEADAFVWAATHGADVISCSWGPADGDWFDAGDPIHNMFVPIPDSTRLAIDFAINNGRNGKGCLVLFAAGNGNESVENDGYASYDNVIAVAASNDRGKRSVYSDFGKSIWCSFPSSDFGWPDEGHPEPLTPGIWTTDRSGAAGYNSGSIQDGDAAGNYTNSFGGTSSACPGAAGVAALVLARNSALRWDEVRDILKRSCARIDPQGGNYDATGHSPFYGYGRLDAEAAVRLALPSAAPNAVKVSRTFNLPILDFQTARGSLSVGENGPIEAIKVDVDIRHTYIGDLVVRLIPPPALNLQPIVLHDRAGGSRDNIQKIFDILTTPALSVLKGKSAAGPWTLEVSDTERIDQGSLTRFGVELQLGATVERVLTANP